jgi:NCS1 family nucleobase:cation symporter-1
MNETTPSLPADYVGNRDLAPVPEEERTWSYWNFAALWIGMAVCVPTYMMASGLIAQGMTIGQALLTIALGNVIVLIPMVLNAHAGTKHGIPFPILLRSSFGIWGANIPAVMRGLVACGWFGIQTWIGGFAIYSLHAVIFGFTPAEVGSGAFLGLTLGQLGCFLLFWAVNMAVIVAGIDSIKWLENFAAPFLIVMGLVLLGWAASGAGGFSGIFSAEVVARIRGNQPADFSFWSVFWPNLTAMVGFWATLSLNIPDFTRYARSQRDQILGQAMGLPPTMILFSFIGVAVTCATVVIFGEAIWDPVVLLGRFEHPVVVGFCLFALTIATLSTNIAANIVSPANDISNLSPRQISFRTGGLIAGCIGILIMPWKLITDLGGYIFTWLIGYSALLGAIGGVMIADYYVIKRTELDVDDLYRSQGRYRYGSGFNWRALTAMVLGILPCIPGFLEQALGPARVDVPVWLSQIYTYAWFVSFAIAFLSHLVLSNLFPPAAQGESRHP